MSACFNCRKCSRRIDCTGGENPICELCEVEMEAHPYTTPIRTIYGEKKPDSVEWMIKCCTVGCRVYGAENLIQWARDLWCPKHFNNMQRQQCIDRGCRHKIPAPD